MNFLCVELFVGAGHAVTRPKNKFLGTSEAITRPYKLGSFVGVGDGVNCP